MPSRVIVRGDIFTFISNPTIVLIVYLQLFSFAKCVFVYSQLYFKHSLSANLPVSMFDNNVIIPTCSTDTKLLYLCAKLLNGNY